MTQQKSQQFEDFDDWVRHASTALTAHPNYGENRPWNNAVCIDAHGRICRIGADFMRARDENTFPIRWWWPDQKIEELDTSPTAINNRKI